MPDQVRRFTLDVEGCKWYITMAAVPPDGHDYVTAYDGTSTFAIQTGITAKTNSITPYFAGYVKPEPVPFHSGSRAQAVWLALATHCYLDQEAAGSISPAWIYIHRTVSAALGERFPAKIERLKQLPNLPQNIDCWRDDFVYENSHKKSRVLSSGGTKVLAFQYEALTTTNIGKFQLPLTGAIKYFIAQKGSGPQPRTIQVELDEIRVAELVAPCSRTTWRPPLPGRARVQDFRLATAARDKATYDVIGPGWLSEGDPRVLGPRVENNSLASGTRYWRIAVILALCAVTGIFLAVSFRPRH